MTRLPDESIFLQNTTGDSGIENLYVYGKLNYDFKNDDITVKSLTPFSGGGIGGIVGSALAGGTPVSGVVAQQAAKKFL